jgi:hypothetical protein
MRAISILTGVIPILSQEQLSTVVVLSGFGLAAFAIYAVVLIAREKSK